MPAALRPLTSKTSSEVYCSVCSRISNEIASSGDSVVVVAAVVGAATDVVVGAVVVEAMTVVSVSAVSEAPDEQAEPTRTAVMATRAMIFMSSPSRMGATTEQESPRPTQVDGGEDGDQTDGSTPRRHDRRG